MKFHSGQCEQGMLQRHSIFKTLQWLRLSTYPGRRKSLAKLYWGQAVIVSYVDIAGMWTVLLHTSYVLPAYVVVSSSHY